MLYKAQMLTTMGRYQINRKNIHGSYLRLQQIARMNIRASALVKSRVFSLIVVVVLSFVTFQSSIFLLGEYKYGDQVHYRNFYDRLDGVNFREITRLQVSQVGGAEPIYGVLMWVGANLGVPKDTYISFFNVLLVVLFFFFLRKFNVSLILILLLLTNFYLVVLLTSAERLKFSYIFLILAAITSGWPSKILSVLAPFAHFQTLINYLSLLFERLSKIRLLRRIKLSALIKSAIVIPIAAAFFLFVFFNYSEAIVSKTVGHSEQEASGLFSLVNLIGLFLIGIFVTKDRVRFCMAMLPIFLVADILGTARVNMIGVVVFYFFLLREGRGNHIVMYPLMTYFSFKSIGYIRAIIEHGDGFA